MNATQEHARELAEIRTRHNQALAAVQTIRRTLVVRDAVQDRMDKCERGIRCALHLRNHGHISAAKRVLGDILP